MRTNRIEYSQPKITDTIASFDHFKVIADIMVSPSDTYRYIRQVRIFDERLKDKTRLSDNSKQIILSQE